MRQSAVAPLLLLCASAASGEGIEAFGGLPVFSTADWAARAAGSEVTIALFALPWETAVTEPVAAAVAAVAQRHPWLSAGVVDCSEAEGRAVADVYGVASYPAVRIINGREADRDAAEDFPLAQAITRRPADPVALGFSLTDSEGLGDVALALAPSRVADPRTGMLQRLLHEAGNPEAAADFAAAAAEGEPPRCVAATGEGASNETLGMLRAAAYRYQHRLRFALAPAADAEGAGTITCGGESIDIPGVDAEGWARLTEWLEARALTPEQRDSYIAAGVGQRREAAAAAGGKASSSIPQLQSDKQWQRRIVDPVQSVSVVIVMRRDADDFDAQMAQAEELSGRFAGGGPKQIPFRFFWIDASEEQAVVKAFKVSTKPKRLPSVLFFLPVQSADQSGAPSGQLVKAWLKYQGPWDVDGIAHYMENAILGDSKNMVPLARQNVPPFSAQGAAQSDGPADERPGPTLVDPAKLKPQRGKAGGGAAAGAAKRKKQEEERKRKAEEERKRKEKKKKDKPLSAKEQAKLDKIKADVEARKAAKEKRMQEKREREEQEKEERKKQKEEEKQKRKEELAKMTPEEKAALKKEREKQKRLEKEKAEKEKEKEKRRKRAGDRKSWRQEQEEKMKAKKQAEEEAAKAKKKARAERQQGKAPKAKAEGKKRAGKEGEAEGAKDAPDAAEGAAEAAKAEDSQEKTDAEAEQASKEQEEREKARRQQEKERREEMERREREKKRREREREELRRRRERQARRQATEEQRKMEQQWAAEDGEDVAIRDEL